MMDQHEHAMWHSTTDAIKALTEVLKKMHSDHETKTAILHRLAEMETKIMKELDDLTAQVEATKTVAESAITLINGIADRITAAGVDPAKLATLTATLKKEDEDLAAAVLANTPGMVPPA